jgi:hypothetical protein
MATIKKVQLGGSVKKAVRQYGKAVKEATREAHKGLPKKKVGGKVKVKKAQKGCAIARENARADRKAIREWGRMAKSEKASERVSKRAERRSERESRPSGSKLRSGSFMFKSGGKVKKAVKKK